MKKNATLKKYTIETITKTQQDAADFNFYSFTHFLKDADHLKKSHRHDFYTFILTLDGSGSQLIDFEEYEIEQNRLFFINYDQIHSWKITGKVEGYLILFSKAFYNLIYTGNDIFKSEEALEKLPTYIDIPPEEIQDWLRQFESIAFEFKKSEKFSNELICLMLKSCVLKMQRNSEKDLQDINLAEHRNVIAAEFRKLVNQHYREMKTSKDYANLLNITPNYLNTLIKQTFGKPAGIIIRNRIILEAKRLLSHSDLSVRQISLELGFTDNSHFGKYFRNATAMTPLEFRTDTINR